MCLLYFWMPATCVLLLLLLLPSTCVLPLLLLPSTCVLLLLLLPSTCVLLLLLLLLPSTCVLLLLLSTCVLLLPLLLLLLLAWLLPGRPTLQVPTMFDAAAANLCTAAAAAGLAFTWPTQQMPMLFMLLPPTRVLLLLLLCSQANPADANEGELSVQKATLVRNVQLARKARGQNSLLQLERHMLLLPLSSVKDCASDYTPTGTYPGSSSSSTGCAVGLQRPSSCEREERGKRLADGVEALIGAVYLTAAAAVAGASGMSEGGAAAQGIVGRSSMPVSEQGLAAAAAFCEAVGILPPGAQYAGRCAVSRQIVLLSSMPGLP
jgi:hypothetical protein